MTRNEAISILQFYARHKISSIYHHLSVRQGAAIFFFHPEFELSEWEGKIIRDLWR